MINLFFFRGHLPGADYSDFIVFNKLKDLEKVFARKRLSKMKMTANTCFTGSGMRIKKGFFGFFICNAVLCKVLEFISLIPLKIYKLKVYFHMPST